MNDYERARLQIESQESHIRELEADLEIVRHSLNIKSVDLESMRMERDAAVKRAESAEAALDFTVPFRDFSDEWHDATNESVVRFRELRQAALAHDAAEVLKDKP